jgi:hypothetical protein
MDNGRYNDPQAAVMVSLTAACANNERKAGKLLAHSPLGRGTDYQ